MVIHITPEMSKEEVTKKLEEIRPKKKFNILSHFGKVKWDEDAVTYQRRLRDE